jgi:hypothetical protein
MKPDNEAIDLAGCLAVENDDLKQQVSRLREVMFSVFTEAARNQLISGHLYVSEKNMSEMSEALGDRV